MKRSKLSMALTLATAMGGLVGGAAGALVGNRIDAATRSAEILYRAP